MEVGTQSQFPPSFAESFDTIFFKFSEIGVARFNREKFNDIEVYASNLR